MSSRALAVKGNARLLSGARAPVWTLETDEVVAARTAAIAASAERHQNLFPARNVIVRRVPACKVHFQAARALCNKYLFQQKNIQY